VRRDRAQLESSIVPLQSLIRGYLLRMRRAEGLLGALERKTEPLEDDYDEGTEQYEDAQEDLDSEIDENEPSLRDQFYQDLRDYIDVSGIGIELRPVINGRKIELWDLFSAVTQQDRAAEDRDWRQVARRLGFDWMGSTGCPKELKECYNRNLAEFEEAIGSYDDQDGTVGAEDEHVPLDEEKQALVQISDAVTAPKEPSPAPLRPAYRSSSPITGVKRSFQHSNELDSELGYPSYSSSKRRRRDPEAAIPQTPEHRLRFAAGSSSHATVQDWSSPSKSRGAKTDFRGVLSMDDADALLADGFQDTEEIDQLPDPAPAGKRRFIEPETQDFGPDIGGEDDIHRSIKRDDIGYVTDEDGVTPSQQLLSEFEEFSSPTRPAPFRGYSKQFAPKPRLPGGPGNNTGPFVPRAGDCNGSAGRAERNSHSMVKATKRSLPQQYQTQQATSATAPARNGMAARRLQSNSPVVAQPTGVYLSPRSEVFNHQSKQKVSSNPTWPLQSSAQHHNPSRRIPASTAPVSKPARTQNRGDSPDFDEEYIDAQFEHFTALGYDVRHIGRALEVASFQRGPMTVALESLKAGKGIPQNEPGVWTDDDDEKLRKVREYDRMQRAGVGRSTPGANAREKAQMERYRSDLLEKHRAWVAHRVAFMSMVERGAPT
jgi:hypothetical protein